MVSTWIFLGEFIWGTHSYSLTHSYLLTYSLTHLLTHSLTLTHSLLLTHSLTLTHSLLLTHSYLLTPSIGIALLESAFSSSTSIDSNTSTVSHVLAHSDVVKMGPLGRTKQNGAFVTYNFTLVEDFLIYFDDEVNLLGQNKQGTLLTHSPNLLTHLTYSLTHSPKLDARSRRIPW